MKQDFSFLTRLWPHKPENHILYHRCSDTPLDVFIDVLVNKNMPRLVRTGKATPKEIDSAWQKLWFEYCDLSGSPEYRQLFGLIKEVGYLEGKLMSIRLAIQSISSSQSNGCINILHNYGYRYAFEKSKPDEFEKDIQRVIEKSKTIELLIKAGRAQIDKINEKAQGESVKEDWFEDTLTVLSKYMGYRINRKVITVSEFVRMKKMFEMEAERMNNKSGKPGI
jgi:hypothetical protein